MAARSPTRSGRRWRPSAGSSSSCEADLAEGDSRRGYIERVLLALDRQDRLVENLLTLSTPSRRAPQALIGAGAAAEVMRHVPARPAPPVIVEAPDPALPPVWGDAFRLGEVFANLIQNALQATPDRARCT